MNVRDLLTVDKLRAAGFTKMVDNPMLMEGDVDGQPYVAILTADGNNVSAIFRKAEYDIIDGALGPHI